MTAPLPLSLEDDEEPDLHVPEPAPPFNPNNVPTNSVWQWRGTVHLADNPRKGYRHRDPKTEL